MTSKTVRMEFDEYTTKIMEIDKNILKASKCKYDILFTIVKEISLLFGKHINLVSGFKNIPIEILQENLQNIKDIFINNNDKLMEIFNINIDFKKFNDHKKIVSILRAMAKQINFIVQVRNSTISIHPN